MQQRRKSNLSVNDWQIRFYEVAPTEVVEIKDAAQLPADFGKFLQKAVSRAQHMLRASF